MGEEEREKEGGERERVEGTKYNGEYLRRGKGSERIPEGKERGMGVNTTKIHYIRVFKCYNETHYYS